MTLPDDWMQQLRQTYPRRDGGQSWAALQRLIPAAMSRGATWERILEGSRRYRIWCGRKAITGTEFVMQAKTFYGRDEHWEEWADFDLRDPKQILEDAERIDLQQRAIALGYTEVDYSKGLAVVRRAVEAAEVKRLAQQAGERGVELPKLRLVNK